jgi:hypothetical protein
MNRNLRNRRDSFKVYNQPNSIQSIPSTTSNLGWSISFRGDMISTSSMPSRLSTVRRFAHAEITDSGSFEVDFVFEDFALGLDEDVLDFVDDFGFFFWGLKSSSSESTLLGIGQSVIPETKWFVDLLMSMSDDEVGEDHVKAAGNSVDSAPSQGIDYNRLYI